MMVMKCQSMTMSHSECQAFLFAVLTYKLYCLLFTKLSESDTDLFNWSKWTYNNVNIIMQAFLFLSLSFSRRFSHRVDSAVAWMRAVKAHLLSPAWPRASSSPRSQILKIRIWQAAFHSASFLFKAFGELLHKMYHCNAGTVWCQWPLVKREHPSTNGQYNITDLSLSSALK